MKIEDYEIEIYIDGQYQSGLPRPKKKGSYITLYYPNKNAKLTLEYMSGDEYERINYDLTKAEQRVYHLVEDKAMSFIEVSEKCKKYTPIEVETLYYSAKEKIDNAPSAPRIKRELN